MKQTAVLRPWSLGEILGHTLHFYRRRRNVRVFLRSGILGGRPVERENGAETQVLDHGELPEHLVAPHFVHPAANLAPALRSTDIVQHGAGLVKVALLCLSTQRQLPLPTVLM